MKTTAAFLFGSINPDVAPLSEFLGEAAKIIDMIVRPIRRRAGSVARLLHLYLQRQLEAASQNGADGYHVSAVHWNYAATTQHRKEVQAADNIRAMSAGQLGQTRRRFLLV